MHHRFNVVGCQRYCRKRGINIIKTVANDKGAAPQGNSWQVLHAVETIDGKLPSK